MVKRQNIQVKDKTFAVSIPEEEILQRVKAVASRINEDYRGQKPIFLAVLNGAFVFAADLLREIDLPCEITFVKLASYQGTQTTGAVRELIGLNVDITGRPVIVVEDIVDTGVTMAHMLETLRNHKGPSFSACPSPEDWRLAFGDAQYVFCITITSALSGCSARAHSFAYKAPTSFSSSARAMVRAIRDTSSVWVRRVR